MIQEFNQQDLEIVQEDLVYDGFLKVKKVNFKYKMFAGGVSGVVTREVLVRNDAVALVAYDPQLDRILLIEQIRIGALDQSSQKSPWLLELIAGLVDLGEDLAETVIREAKEEANLDIDKVEHVLTFFESPGGTREKIDIFVAQVDLSNLDAGVYGLASENEDIKVHFVAREQAYQWILDGTICNSITIIGLQWLQLHYPELQRKWL